MPADHPGGGSEEGMANAIHGHDLALGSGSWDGIIGGQIYASWRRAFVTAALQYRIRPDPRRRDMALLNPITAKTSSR